MRQLFSVNLIDVRLNPMFRTLLKQQVTKGVHIQNESDYIRRCFR